MGRFKELEIEKMDKTKNITFKLSVIIAFHLGIIIGMLVR